jgi:hypothetical protein
MEPILTHHAIEVLVAMLGDNLTPNPKPNPIGQFPTFIWNFDFLAIPWLPSYKSQPKK